MTPERKAMARRLNMVRDAIATLARELPGMPGAAASTAVPYTEDELMRLAVLAEAAHAARGIITAPAPRAKETVWHELAKLIEWHLRQLLEQAGVALVGDDWNGPLVKLIKVAINLVEDGVTVTEDAISKVLQRAKSDHTRPLRPVGSNRRATR
jgi:hypothetical protein